ncbi:hypothetical protein CJ179_35970 [Rhodococcus sp. ACS1]|uniref:hypothetical protein n=1 Tax=Rhodococcus sp. ACS1 TaxID=2028570 RepID=UPI000BB0D2F5|nr:hypothetical protein [Rhodococcus sp. ACS1]PBC39427.1 hypothetical protein CJ179_35970 [Rhodococcus sp. ACS1]
MLEYRAFEYRQSASHVDPGAITPSVGNSPNLVVPRRYRYDWALFADWCTACDNRVLPAHPSVLAEFLADHPAADGTQRRRVTAINTVHIQAGLLAPGRAETIRQLLNTARADRLARVGERVAQVVPRIPVTGWPGGLFGRRDALVLTLAAAGLGFEQIARLRRADVTSEHDELVVRVGEGWARIAAGGANPAVVYRDWVEVLGFLDRYPSTQLLAGRLDKGAGLSAFADNARRDERPLLTPIDRWGHTPFASTALTGKSIAALVRAHLTGQAPVHKRLPTGRPTTQSGEDAPVPAVADVELDQGYYDRGIAARRDAHTHLEDVTTILDGIEDAADRLLADLLVILDAPELED